MNIPAAFLVLLTVISGVSATILVWAALRPPRIGALVERAAIAVNIVFVGAIYSVVAYDTDMGRIILSTDLARFVVRLAIVSLLLLPTIWMALLLTGRLGEAKRDGLVLRTQCPTCGHLVTLTLSWTGTRLEPYRIIAEHLGDGSHEIRPMWLARK